MASTVTAQPHPDIGTELVRMWQPEGAARAWIVLVHGLAEHSGRYERTGRLLAEAGFGVRSFDLIGAGASGGARWDIDDWTRYHDQIGAHLEWAREQATPVVLMGHSLGGTLCLGFVLSGRAQPDLVVLSAPALAGGAGWQRALVPILAKAAPRLALPNFVNGEHLSRDPGVAEKYFADPLVVTRSTLRFGAAMFAEFEDLTAQIGSYDLPTLVIHGGDDWLVPTVSSEPLGELENVDRRVREGLRHEILNEPEGPELVGEIVEWLIQRL